MNTKSRVLGYYTSKILTNEELTEISGGAAYLTVQTTQQATGQYPGKVDFEYDQIWD